MTKKQRRGKMKRGKKKKTKRKKARIDRLITKFTGDDASLADNAYEQLFELGAAAVGPLLEIAQNTDPYSGDGFYDERSSTVRLDPISVGEMAMYVIESILYDTLTPHLAPRLHCDGIPVVRRLGHDHIARDRSRELADVDIQAEAARIYQEWWEENMGLSLEMLRQLPNPLSGAIVFWSPLLLPLGAGGGGTGAKEAGGTPIDQPIVVDGNIDGKDAGVAPDPYAFLLQPAMPRPYNCLAWAVGCHEDRWIEPAGPGPNNWKEILDDYCYDTSATVPCGGTCQEGQGPKIKMIFHHEPGRTPCTDATWVHAMKQEADGDWR